MSRAVRFVKMQGLGNDYLYIAAQRTAARRIW